MKRENRFQRFLSETDLLYNNRSFLERQYSILFLGIQGKTNDNAASCFDHHIAIASSPLSHRFWKKRIPAHRSFSQVKTLKINWIPFVILKNSAGRRPCRSHLKCNINEKRPLPQYITHLLRVRVCVTFSQKSGTKIRKNAINYRFLTFSTN